MDVIPTILLLLLGLVLAVAWIVVPFAVFGLQGSMKDLLNEVKRTNELLSMSESERVMEPPKTTVVTTTPPWEKKP